MKPPILSSRGSGPRPRFTLHLPPSCGFSLVELLTSLAIFSIVLVAMGEMVGAVVNQLRIGEARFSQFQESQAAFDSITRRLSTCELNPYYDFQYPGNPPDTSAVPSRYDLESDLHFVSGPAASGSTPLLASGYHPGHAVFFHGTFGLSDNPAWSELGTLLNSWGYYLEFGDDDGQRADFLNVGPTSPRRYRFRLKELQVPAEALRTYAAGLNTQNNASGLYSWFRTAAGAGQAHTLAENVVALVISPLSPVPETGSSQKETDIAPAYFYDTRAYQHAAASSTLMQRTRHQLPPLLRVTLVAVDEPSAQRLAEESGAVMPDLQPPGIFQDATKFQSDLQQFESVLTERKLRFRTFSTTIRLRNARWSDLP